MKSDNNLFKIENELLIFNKDEARLIPEYKAIIIRDKGSEGDYDGRKKLQAFKELLYIYLVNHPASIYRDLAIKSRKENARVHADLDSNWKEDELILEASKRFQKDLHCSSLYHSYINASRGLHSIGEDLSYFNNRREKIRRQLTKLEDKLDKLPHGKEHEEDREHFEQKIDSNVKTLQAIANSISTLSNSLPDSYATLQKLKKQLAEEEGNDSEIRGGGKVNNREA